MLTAARFRLYMFLVAASLWVSFKAQKVYPLELPRSETIEVVPLAPKLPGLYDVRNFPAADRARPRLFRLKVGKAILLGLARRLRPPSTPPVPREHEAYLRAVYPRLYRRIWPDAPRVPPELAHGDDLPAALAVHGPFADSLKAADPSALRAATEGQAEPGDYVVDMSLFEKYEPKSGLLRPGGLAVFGMDGRRLRTKGIAYRGEFHGRGHPNYRTVERAYLCALSTHLTTLQNNVAIHLAQVTPMTVATTNALTPEHPVRRLLHFCFHMTLIGHHELATFQLKGAEGYSTVLFSHEYETLCRLIREFLSTFRIADTNPEEDVRRRGVEETPFDYPRRDNLLSLWRITKDFVDRYVDLYYASDEAVLADRALRTWRAELERLLPNGLSIDRERGGRDDGLSRDELKRICAAFIHVSTALHDGVDNLGWNYGTLTYLIPTVVPVTLEEQEQAIAFDFITTVIGTWKPFNMLLDGISVLALDSKARALMEGYVEGLRELGRRMEASTPDPGLVYPKNLNYSVSN